MTQTYGPGDQIGPYRVIGTYPGGAFRALHECDHARRVHLDVRETSDDWREHAVQLLRAMTLLAGLDHPGVARIVDRGVLPERRPWVASELAEGVVLSDVLAARTLAVDETLALVRDLAAIAAHVHAHGVLHGAIHPHAIVLRTGERRFPIQLGGFCELRVIGSDIADAIALSPYSAPEVTLDGRADVYTIGVLAHRALTGRLPGAHVPELIAGVPGAVSSLIVRMLARDPADRPDAAAVHARATALTGDRVLGGPRFTRPRWTPAQPHAAVDAERVASVIDLADARRRRA